MIQAETFNACLTGIASMDFEHWHLLKQLDRAYVSDTIQDAQAKVEQFIVAWKLHHEHEDQLMHAIQFPGEIEHIEGHARLVTIYQRLQNDALNGSYDRYSVKAYIDMVAQLVLDHINQYDSQYALWAKSHCTQEQIERFGIGQPVIL